MTMKYINYKNGKSEPVSESVAQLIGERIIDGAKQWQVFDVDNIDHVQMFNLNEICSISNSQSE